MKRMFKKRSLPLLLAVSLLCGCGAEGDKPSDNTETQPPVSGSLSDPDAVYDLMQEKWIRESNDADIETASWNVASCLEISTPNPADADYTTSFSAVEGACHYLLTEQVTVEMDSVSQQPLYTGHSLFLTRTDADSTESVMEPFELKAAPGAAPEEAAEAFLQAYQNDLATLTGMDVSADGIHLFFQQTASEDTSEDAANGHYYRIRTNTEGYIEEVTDLFPALQAGGIVPKEKMLLPGGRCDGAGRCYLGDVSMSRICVIDRDGGLLTVLEDPAGSGKPLAFTGKLPDGAPLYACADFQGQSLFLLSFDGQECRELYRGEYDYLEQCLIRPNGDLLYGKGGELLCWNVVHGTRKSLYKSRDLDFVNCEGIVWGADGKPYAAFQQGDGTFLYGFTDEKAETVTIHIECFSAGSDYLQKCASAYTSRHPGVVIEVSPPETDRELQLSSLITRLSQEEGPELILAMPNDLLALQKNDALADISELLTAEEREPFFPGILEAGRIDSRLYGLACGASFSTLIVSDQVWPEASWTLSDILNIIKDRENSGNPLEYFEAPGIYASSSRDLWALILQNLDHSPLLDLEEGKCYFDSEEFREALVFCKRSHETARDTLSGSVDPEERLQAGTALVCNVSGDLKDFSRTMAMLGEGYHAVGYPTADGKSGHLMLTNQEAYLAVNAKAAHREIIDDFLHYFVSYQAQRQYSFSWIRTDVLTDCIKEGVTTYGYPTPVPLFSQGNSVIVLGGKPDGSSYLPEFLEMANNSHPDNSALDAIRNMILEETDAYFAGDKELDETVRLIQNRIQLYLDESR